MLVWTISFLSSNIMLRVTNNEWREGKIYKFYRRNLPFVFLCFAIITKLSPALLGIWISHKPDYCLRLFPPT